ncbi:SHC-transforming protein 3 [Condylostylus longicornis]|uniref:SHC-transforming protein 3 n=1 Tax=Condylostylus longicornis TaxID=2530218 RepID=UPI00244E2FC1|nr:SHC-transforming protein 3 [Condylostylus longicornis]XP_055388973.1 SHC-transforming protein 3 [Condylostylus longicornis]
MPRHSGLTDFDNVNRIRANNIYSCNNSGGCSYPDEVIMSSGVSFSVRYIGCVEVKTSMKTLDFGTRSQVARECINRVCETAGLKTQKKRRLDKDILQYISEHPCMENAGTNVIINVSSRALNLVNSESGEMVANHDMPKISFASGGDSDTADFLAYVAKNDDGWRACYVLECGGDQTQDLILTIGKAFMLRFNAINKLHPCVDNFNIEKDNEKDYYNDLPGKLPPELCDNDLPQQMATKLNIKKPRERLSSNLIDLNSPPPDFEMKKCDLNLDANSNTANNQQQTRIRDVFDIQPFLLSAEAQKAQLLTESWFHFAIGRPEAESLLKNDGDFLVRESQGKPGQYVLTGLEGNNPKHLLLIDPDGVVQTKDRVFDSISHLINYHWTNSLPIISEKTELVLRNPVIRTSIKTQQQQQSIIVSHQEQLK